MSQFSGIKFDNPDGENMCFSNSTANGLLSSIQFTSRLNQSHCVSCDFFCSMKNSLHNLTIKSSLQLKNWIGFFHQNFNNNDQQDPSEFIQHIIDKCAFLRELTKMGVFLSYKCPCGFITSKEENRNILFADLNGDSLAEVTSKAVSIKNSFWRNCDNCNKNTKHETEEKILFLPKVLIITIKRFIVTSHNRPVRKNCMQIDPSSIVYCDEIDEAVYTTKAVIEHHGKHRHTGHYTATLQTTNGWIICNDKNLCQTNQAPVNGYVFILDKVDGDIADTVEIPSSVQMHLSDAEATDNMTQQSREKSFRGDTFSKAFFLPFCKKLT